MGMQIKCVKAHNTSYWNLTCMSWKLCSVPTRIKCYTGILVGSHTWRNLSCLDLQARFLCSACWGNDRLHSSAGSYKFRTKRCARLDYQILD